jgi:hypothetical protein
VVNLGAADVDLALRLVLVKTVEERLGLLTSPRVVLSHSRPPAL